ncbi:MAG: response regulator [Nitrospirota bacterium]|nr:MAG: response regulator [Nitrospirota bacterium]
MKVLIIDDEKLVRWFLERALKKWDYEVTSVSNGKEAVDALDKESFDLVFTDLKMPVANGSLVIEHLGQIADPPKIIVCSAYITSEMEEDYKNKGILSLKKPFKLDELERIIKKMALPA